MKIIGIVGILNLVPADKDRFWMGIKYAFSQTHPHATFVLARKFYAPWQKQPLMGVQGVSRYSEHKAYVCS